MIEAIVSGVSDSIEEEVVLRVGDVEIVCFVGYSPYSIEEGGEYPVALSLCFLDDFELTESDELCSSLRRIEGGFSYVVTGVLCGDVIDAGVKFQDEMFLSDFGYLSGKMVSVRVDRIDVEFL